MHTYVVCREADLRWFQAQHNIGQGERANPGLSWSDKRTCPVRDVLDAFVLPCSRKV